MIQLSLFDLIINVVESFFISLFNVQYVDLKTEKYKKIYFIILTIIMFSETTALNMIVAYEGVLFFIYIFTLFLFDFIISENEVGEIFIIALLTITMISFCNAVSLSIITTVSKMSVYEILSGGSILFYLAVVFSKLLFFIMQINVRKYLKKIIIKNNHHLMLFIVFFLLSNLCLSWLESILFTGNYRERDVFYTIIAFGIINVIAIWLYYLIQVDNENFFANRESLHEIMLSNEYKMDQEIKNKEMHALKHDMENAYLVLFSLLEEGKTEKAKKLLSEQLNLLDSVILPIVTDNNLINNVINYRQNKAEKSGIRIEAIITINSFHNVNEIYFASVLSLALDNAIEHSAFSKNNQRKIELEIRENYDGYSISVLNPVNCNILETNPNLDTSKQGAGHGFGIKTINALIKMSDGIVEYKSSNDFFQCLIFFPFQKT